jgi:hypothetical protein
MSVISYNQFLSLFKEIADKHYQIKRFGSGELSEADINKSISENQKFPVLWATPTSVTTQPNTVLYTFNLLVFDIVDKDKLNQNEVLSDTLQIILDILRILRYDNNEFNVITDPNIEPFGGNYSEWVFGWNMTVEIEVDFQQNTCDIPYKDLDLTSIIKEISTTPNKFDCNDLADCPIILSIINSIGIINNILPNKLDLSGVTINGVDGITVSGSSPNFVIGFSGSTGGGNNPIYTKELLSGGAVWSGVGLDFDVSILSYRFYTENILFSNATTVTLSSGDTTFNRIDAIVVDVDGNVTVIQGTPSIDPATPNIPSNQLLVNFVIIGANATTPQVNQLVVYKENVEWLGSFDTGIGNVIFNNTIDPYEGIFATYVNQINNIQRTIYTSDIGNINPTLYQTLSFRVKLINPLPPIGTIQVNLALSGSVVGNSINATAFGLNASNTSNYQLVVIPISFFGASNINQVILRPTSPNGADLYSFYLDNIIFQDGTNPPPIGNTLTIKQSGTTVNNNVSTINFFPPLVASVGSTPNTTNVNLPIKNFSGVTYDINDRIFSSFYTYDNNDIIEQRFEFDSNNKIIKKEYKDDLLSIWKRVEYTWNINKLDNVTYTTITGWTIT